MKQQAIFYGCMTTLVSTLGITNFIILPVLLQMVLYTLPIIYIGSHMSLRQAEIDSETGERPMKVDSIKKKEALLFPIIGSCVLLTLYVAYKLVEPHIINLLLTLYLTVVGSIALAETIALFLEPLSSKALLKPDLFKREITTWPIASKEDPLQFSCCWLQVISYSASIILSIVWILTKNWMIHNLFAISFCIQAISLISVGSFTVASILLTGLFFYDILWVFGTEVMVTVARLFEAPAKIIFPASFDPWQQSILGLGDVVIPGIFISMCLRFDSWLQQRRLNNAVEIEQKTTISDIKKSDVKKNETNESSIKENVTIDIHESFRKFYFWVVAISYELGLLTTGLVMFIFKHPQPALLYLVPCCLLSLFGAAAIKGQITEIFSYQEDDNNSTTIQKNENDENENGETVELTKTTNDTAGVRERQAKSSTNKDKE